MDRNPALLLQRVKRSMQQESDDHGQAFSELQWSYVMQAADLLAPNHQSSTSAVAS